MAHATGIAVDRDVFHERNDPNYFTRIDSWIDALNTNRGNLKRRQLIAKSRINSAIRKLQQIRAMFEELRDYRR